MIQTVLKRDGRIVGYNEEKIKAAIRKAMLQTEMGEDETLIQKIADRIGVTGKEQMTVEEIQDRVELELMKSPRKEVAKRYIAYRDQRSIARRAKTRDMFLEIIEAKDNDITRENANMNTDSPAGMMMKFASETTKPFVDDYLLSAEARDAVRNGLPAHPRQRLLTPPRASHASSIRSTAYFSTDSQPATENHAPPSASRRQASSDASRLRQPRTKCTAARPYRPSTSISRHSSDPHTSRRSRIWNLFQEKTCHTSTTPKSTISSSATSMASKMRHACSNTP